VSTLHTSEKTDQGMLPQSPALESASADKPGVGTKRGVDHRLETERQTGVQHGQGEIADGITFPPQRHSNGKALAKPDGDRGLATPCNTKATCSIAVPKQTAQHVFVLDKHGQPLQPCRPARARKLLADGRARVHRLVPFVIRLVDREVIDSQVSGVEVGIAPGSKTTGMSVFTISNTGGKTGNQVVCKGVVSIEIQHRGQLIHKKMQQRSNYRRRRRSANLRYRAPRFNNRTRPSGWLAPSLKHRVDSTAAMMDRIRRWAPVTAVHQGLWRFDTQKMQDPEISGVEYQRGELAGYEVREYLLEKFGRTCAYCGDKDTSLNIDHIRPRSGGGSDRVSNLALACIACNQAKNSMAVGEWLTSRYGADRGAAIAKKVLARAKAPLRDAAAVNSTRWALYQRLKGSGLPVLVSSGARTKWNRTRFGLPKSHSLDALCVGTVDGIRSYPDQVLVAKAMGRGSYARTCPDAYGFPRLRMPRTKRVHGFQTGDLVRAVVPKGKNAGTHVGRVAVRSRGWFRIGAAECSWRNCTLLQRADGYEYKRKEEAPFHSRLQAGVPTAL